MHEASALLGSSGQTACAHDLRIFHCGADFYMSLYNVIFSVLPPLVIGIFDQDVNREMSRLYPGVFHDMEQYTIYSLSVTA